jgi:hypothetical protein
MVTSAVQGKLCQPDDLVRELAAGPQNGSGFLRRALADVLDGAASVAEATAVDELRATAVPAFELNVPIIARGVVVAVADVLWRELRAVLEVDSREYHYSETGWNATMERHNRLTSAGLTLTHYSPSRIRSGALRNSVEPWLRARAAELGVPYRPDPRPIRPDHGRPEPFHLP